MAKKLKEYFDAECINYLAGKINEHSENFDSESFCKACLSEITPLELKDRVRVIGYHIDACLTGDYKSKLNILSKILGPPNEGSYGTFNDYFWQWPLSSVVEQFGASDRESSFRFVYELTQRSTGEFAVRPFLLDDPEYVFKKLSSWSRDKNFHVRRLSSEGLRPLLPWAKKCNYFVDKPSKIFKHLKSLSRDSEKYVLTSVANHMGDMLKLNPDATKAELEKWNDSKSPETQRVVNHAIRNLRKKKDDWALAMRQ